MAKGGQRARALLALAALLAPWACAHAQQDTMSLEEASYRAGKARIMARYHDDLANCKGLGNAHARSACAAAAGVNRDTARRALRNDTGPTRLSRSLAQMASEKPPTSPSTTRMGAHAPAAGAPPVHLAVATTPPALKPLPAHAAKPASTSMAVATAPTAAPALTVATPPQASAKSVPSAMVLMPIAAQPRVLEPESARTDDFALALKTHYGGN